MIRTLIILTALLIGCTQPVESPASADVDCTVIQFTVSGNTEAICAVECRWRGNSKGYTNSTPAPCEWFSKKVTRQ